MDLKYDERYDAFRHEIRSFLKAHGSSRPQGNLVYNDREKIAMWLSLWNVILNFLVTQMCATGCRFSPKGAK